MVGLPSLKGFWSYASEQKELSGKLHQALESSLAEHLGRARSVKIFRDNRIPNGHRFQEQIVDAIAGSAVFFWLQSPSSFSSHVCQFELAMFRAQVERVAKEFSTSWAKVDADRLWNHWFTPIRWIDINDAVWPELVNTEDDLARRQLWLDSQVPPTFNIASAEHTERSFDQLANGMAHAVFEAAYISARQLFPDNDMNAVLTYLAEPDPEFRAYWLAHFPSGPTFRAGAVLLGTAQRRLAAARTGGMMRDQLGKLKLELFLMPADKKGEDGFWVASKPIGAPHAERFVKVLEAGRRGVNGHWLWPAEAAGAITGFLAEDGLCLPTLEQAAILQHHAVQGSDACASLGWTSPVGNFWTTTPEGKIIPAGAAAADLPVLLVKPLGTPA